MHFLQVEKSLSSEQNLPSTMKPFFAICLFLLLSSGASAQLTDVVTGVFYPIDMAQHGDELYISAQSSFKISKINLLDPNPVEIDVVTGLNFVPSLAVHGDDLYFSEAHENRISKLDLTDPNAVATVVVSGLSHPYGLAVKGDELYFAERTGHRVSKIDLNASSPVPVMVAGVTGNPADIAIHGNDLYIMDSFEGNIKYKDLTDTVVASTVWLSGLIATGMTIHNGYLYASDHINGKIHQVLLSTQATTDYVTGLNEPHATVITGPEMYIAEAGAWKVSKFSDLVLPIEEEVEEKSPTLYPNPAGSEIRLQGLERETDFVIYNGLGQVLRMGEARDQEMVSLDGLERGIYFLVLSGEKTFKFVKE